MSALIRAEKFLRTHTRSALTGRLMIATNTNTVAVIDSPKYVVDVCIPFMVEGTILYTESGYAVGARRSFNTSHPAVHVILDEPEDDVN